ncbi:MAG: response regulator [Candidatus Omnitrophica bacterium]|nr:response regulator [Candidatus Omnitrophota bacterium]
MMSEVLTTHQVAQYCHVTMTTVVNWIEDGSLPAYKTKGGHRRIKKNDLISFLKKHNMPVPSKRRIMIVDDDESIRDGFEKLFRAKGFEVDIAKNGFEAGVLIVMKQPEIVILDLIMPELDGFFVCEYIRKHSLLSHTKIIVLTGFPSKTNLKRAKDLKVNLCLSKPIDNETLITETERILNE